MSTRDADTIEVRSDERLDWDRIEGFLREHLPRLDGEMVVRQFGGGHANLTYLLRFGDEEYVFRRPPLGPVAPSSHDMGREHRVLSRLPDAYPLAPRSLLFHEDAEVAGAPFHVMERRRGIVLRRELPERFDTTDAPGLHRRMGEMLIDALADLHGVAPGSVGLGDLGRPEGFVGRQLSGWTRRWEASRDRDVDGVPGILEWLGERVPSSETVALLHNDYKPDNVMVSGSDPAVPVAVLDWDMCTRGDPLMDLGYLLIFWHDGNEDPPWWIETTPRPRWYRAFPSRDEAVARYAARTGFDTGQIEWYRIFALFKLMVIVQQIYIRYVRGQTADGRFASFGERVRSLAGQAAEAIHS